MSNSSEENLSLRTGSDTQYKDLEKHMSAMQPFGQVPEGCIAQKYEELQKAIDIWVYDAMVDCAEDTLHEFFKEPRDELQSLYESFRQPQCRIKGLEIQRFIFDTNVETMRSCERSNFFILSVLIRWILDEYVFSERYPVGIYPEQAQFISDIADGMRCYCPPRDQLTIDKCTSETLIALMALPEFSHRHEDHSRAILSKAMNILRPFPFLNHRGSSSLLSSFRREILNPTIDLHHHIKSSILRYHMTDVDITGQLSPREMLQQWNLKNAVEWGPVTKEVDAGQALWCLHPSLHRCGVDAGESVVLVKPMMVTALTE